MTVRERTEGETAARTRIRRSAISIFLAVLFIISPEAIAQLRNGSMADHSEVGMMVGSAKRISCSACEDDVNSYGCWNAKYSKDKYRQTKPPSTWLDWEIPDVS